ncbi:chorismate lyase [Crenobacter cavernae]|uniref:Chorismate lyase n=2 Tax=Crenobacter cavernae TaxID=2290923 RepID=A0A345Y303_9NEIS|nr:chorismate lyase [Crenobacter cavernae]
MRAMNAPNLWGDAPPAVPAAVLPCLTESGSLTERLIATGHRFDVVVRFQGKAVLFDEESGALSLPRGSIGTVREVVLTLDDVPVVVARSVARLGCPVWKSVLTRGNRSLGFTLFGELPELTRAPLSYAEIDERHPLYPGIARIGDKARHVAPQYAARRSRFTMRGETLLLCEAFLPTLADFLR